MDRKIRVGIIGCGGIAGAHIVGYKSIPELAEVVACCDLDGNKAERYAKHNGIPASYTDYKEMFKCEKLDAVHLCLPHYIHTSVAIDAFENGINVISEKPFCAQLSRHFASFFLLKVQRIKAK